MNSFINKNGRLDLEKQSYITFDNYKYTYRIYHFLAHFLIGISIHFLKRISFALLKSTGYFWSLLVHVSLQSSPTPSNIYLRNVVSQKNHGRSCTASSLPATKCRRCKCHVHSNRGSKGVLTTTFQAQGWFLPSSMKAFKKFELIKSWGYYKITLHISKVAKIIIFTLYK